MFDVVIFDIDGTLAKTSPERIKFLKPKFGSSVEYNGGKFVFLEELKTKENIAALENEHGVFLADKSKIKFKPDYDSFNDSLELDAPNANIVKICQALSEIYPIYICTGRNDKFRERTEQWLCNNDIPYCELMMRPCGNEESDAVVKKRMLDAIQRTCNIVAVFDDKEKVVNMWRENGILCCQVAKGEY